MELLFQNIIPVLHGVHSVQRLIEASKIVFGFGFKYFIASRVMGAAATQGIPEVHKIAFKMNRNFIVLNDLPEVIDLLKPKITYLVVPPNVSGSSVIDYNEIRNAITGNEKVLIVFTGGEPGFSRKELELGRVVKVVDFDVGYIGLIAITLHEIIKNLTS